MANNPMIDQLLANRAAMSPQEYARANGVDPNSQQYANAKHEAYKNMGYYDNAQTRIMPNGGGINNVTKPIAPVGTDQPALANAPKTNEVAPQTNLNIPPIVGDGSNLFMRSHAVVPPKGYGPPTSTLGMSPSQFPKPNPNMSKFFSNPINQPTNTEGF